MLFRSMIVDEHRDGLFSAHEERRSPVAGSLFDFGERVADPLYPSELTVAPIVIHTCTGHGHTIFARMLQAI